MKLISRHLPYVFLFAAVLAFAACSKDGSQGPAGPAGADGAAGPAGAAGAGGAKGDTGVANVIYSAWQNVVFDSIRDNNGVPTGEGYVGMIEAPKLTNDILTKGLINVYFNIDSASVPYIAPLPYIDSQIFARFEAEAGFIWIVSNANLSSGTIPGSTSPLFQFRYVLVPGGVAARSASGGVDWKNYQSVQKFLGLKN